MAKVEKTLANGTTEVKQKEDKKQKNTKKSVKAKDQKQKRSRVKETMSELKKVSWPSFGKTMKQTGMVISVVVLFMLVTLGIDSLLSWLLKLITNI
ncbi:MAG: preprotein translocase subunit SecE [Clostridia bacterium]|nr:preprotein translocase subunit SecE [Clostridia bacterium]